MSSKGSPRTVACQSPQHSLFSFIILETPDAAKMHMHQQFHVPSSTDGGTQFHLSMSATQQPTTGPFKTKCTPEIQSPRRRRTPSQQPFFVHAFVERRTSNSKAPCPSSKQQNMALLQLPNELLLQIGELLSLLPEAKHLNAYLQTNRRLAILVQPIIDKIAVPVDLGRRKRVLHWASERGYERLVGALLDNGSYVGALDCNGWTPLLHAAANGHAGIIIKLLNKGANIEARSYWGDRETALHCAALEGQEAAVRALVERGAELDTKAQSRSTALHFAVEFEKAGIVKFLIDNGASINIQKDDETGNTAIHLAIQNEDELILVLLLESGANITAQNRRGDTALHLAAADKTRPEMVKVLLEKGANPTIQNKRNETPLHLAATNNNTEAVFRMLRIGAATIINACDVDNNTPLLCAAAGSEPTDVKRVNSNRLARHRSFERLPRRNTDPVHDARAASIAMESTKNEIIRMLLENGADVNHQGKHQQTALHLAAVNGYEEMARILIEKGADVALKDENGCTALDLVGEYLHKYRESGAAGRGTVLGLLQLLRKESGLNRRDSIQISPGGLRELGLSRKDSISGGLRELGLVRRDSVSGSSGGLRELGLSRRDSITSSPGSFRDLISPPPTRPMSSLRELRSPPPARPMSVNEIGLQRKLSRRAQPGVRFPIRVVQRVNSLGNLSEAAEKGGLEQ